MDGMSTSSLTCPLTPWTATRAMHKQRIMWVLNSFFCLYGSSHCSQINWRVENLQWDADFDIGDEVDIGFQVHHIKSFQLMTFQFL